MLVSCCLTGLTDGDARRLAYMFAGGRGGAAGVAFGAPGGAGGESRGGRGGRGGGSRGSGGRGGRHPGAGAGEAPGGGHVHDARHQKQNGSRPVSPPGIEVKMGAKLVDRALVFLPFFPSDNPGGGGSAGGVDRTQTADMLKMADEGLEALLAAPLHCFWSHLAHDSSLQVARGHACFMHLEAGPHS